MNDLEVCSWPIDRPIPYARNSRKIPERAVDKVAASIKEFGWRVPIVVDKDGVIICGHTRLLAAKKLGLEQVPVHVADNLTPAQVKAYRLMDNRSHQETDWDIELLGPELEELQGLGIDLSLTGFDGREIDEFLSDPGDDDRANAAPPLPENSVARLGDLWVLGKHRLVCGDCTQADVVAQLIGAVKPHLMVTDPPYGVDYDPEWRKRAGVNNSDRMGRPRNDDRSDWRLAWSLFPGGVAYVWHGALHAAVVAEGLASVGFEIRAQIIWAKKSLIIGRGHYHWQHEPCWYAARDTAKWQGDRKQSTLWPIESRNQDAETIHSTQKPVECMRRPILNHTKRGEPVYDPFLGSGTTLIAAEMIGRTCYGIELDPKYIDVVVVRWQNFTGEQATLGGQTFAQVKDARLGVAA
jgi:DNA modification methylase